MLAIAGPCRRLRRNGYRVRPTHGRPDFPRIPTFVIVFIVSILSRKTPQSRPLAAHISIVHFLLGFVSCFLQHPVHPILKKPSRPAGIPQFALYFLIFDFSSNISPPANVYMYCSHLTTPKGFYAAVGGSAMPAQYPHRLARKRDMPSQRTPGQPNSFSAYSVAEHPSAIPSVPQYLFRKNKPKSKMEELPCPHTITHLPSATSPGARLPSMPWCLDPLIPFRKNKPNRHPSTSTRVSSRASGTSRGNSPSTGQIMQNKPNDKIGKTQPGLVPRCFGALAPFRKNKPNRHPSTWTRVSSRASGASRGISPPTGQIMENKPNLNTKNPTASYDRKGTYNRKEARRPGKPTKNKANANRSQAGTTSQHGTAT